MGWGDGEEIKKPRPGYRFGTGHKKTSLICNAKLRDWGDMSQEGWCEVNYPNEKWDKCEVRGYYNSVEVLREPGGADCGDLQRMKGLYGIE